MQKRLNVLGIKDLIELRDYPASKLVAHFGIMGYHLHRMGQLSGSWKEGFGDDGIETMKSIGHMYTIPKEHRQKDVLQEVLYKLCEMVGVRLRVNGVQGNNISVYFHDKDRIGSGRSKDIGYNVNDGRVIFQECMAMLRAIDPEMKQWQGNLYLIGVTVAGLTPYSAQQSLFGLDEKHARSVAALDKINEKYEDFTIARAPAFKARHILRDSIGFGRMKEFKTSHVRGGQGRFG